jgi:hypothetical protein
MTDIILGYGDSDLTFPNGIRRQFRRAHDAILIEANARMMSLKDSFPASANPKALIYRGADGLANLVYFDSDAESADAVALAEMPRPNTAHCFTPPLYVRS